MRALVTGAAGMLGVDVVDAARAAGWAVDGVTHAELDVRSAAECRDVVAGHDVVINCAAWTDVDGAEEHEPDAFAVNAVGAANVALACQVSNAVMVQISTDYVFPGDATTPYAVDEPISPLNAYGRTKAAGEWAVRAECDRSYVVRTAWLYGEHGPNFVSTMLRLARERETVDVVDDQRGQPTWTRDLAGFLIDLVGAGANFGVHHGTSSGETTWFDFARSVFAGAGLDPGRVRPATSRQFVRPATRPHYSVLANGAAMSDWSDALGRALPGLLVDG